MPGVTVKVSTAVRDRLKALARSSDSSMSDVLEQALACYERTLRQRHYLEAWRQFERDEPEGFAEYMEEARGLARLDHAVPE